MRFTTIIAIILCNVRIWGNRLIGSKYKILPYKVLINLTNSCNSKCSFCDIWKEKDFSNEISIADIIKIFDDMANSLVWLSLSGGEVTLVKKLDLMLLEARKRCKNLKIITFTTNGLLPKKVIELSELIINNGFDLIVTISLDGDRELHDEMRGIPGNYDKCIALYDSLKEMGVNVNYGITISDKNKNYIRDEYKEMRHKIKAVTFVHDGGIYLKSNAVDNTSILESMKYIYKNYVLDSIAEIIEYIHIKIAIQFIEKQNKTNIIPCEVINTSVHIMQDGKVRPCMFLEEMGNIKNDKVSDVIFNSKAVLLRDKIKNDKCPHCWMNCYSPYSIMLHPFYSIYCLLKK